MAGLVKWLARLLAVSALTLSIGVPLLHAQSANASAPDAQSATRDPNPPDRDIQLLREDEDWSFLKDPSLRRDFWDPIKFIPLRSNGEWYMTISGEAREVVEAIGNDNWGQSPFWNRYLNQRYMLGFDIHYGKYVRTFVELKSGLNSFRIGGPRPIDEKKLDFQAAYLQVGTSSSAQNSIEFLVGRQELEYGSGRLIDMREGPNVRLSFDGFRIKSKLKKWNVDAFAMRPDEDNPGFFDNAPDPHVAFWGVYSTRPLPKNTLLDLYYLGLDRTAATFERGTAAELRHSVGGRLSRPIATEKSGWDFDYEALWQFGSFGSAGIRAWTAASETGYRFVDTPLKPHLTVKADISSGDNPRSGDLGTFNPLFPKGNYFGVLATTGPGPINFIDVHPDLELSIPHNLLLSAGWIFQWRESLEDGVYAVPGFLITAANGSLARYVGNRPGTQLRWQANRHLWFQGDYGIFFAGPFLKQAGPGRNLNYWALWAGYEF
jgi:hypothetical protein